MKFNIYETRHLVSQYEMKVINEITPVPDELMRVKKKEEDEWSEVKSLYFSRYVKTYTGGFNSPQDKKIAFFAYECFYMYILMKSGHMRDKITGDKNMKIIFGNSNNDNTYKLIVVETDNTNENQNDDIAKQYNLDEYTICYFDLNILADDNKVYDCKVYNFTVKNDENKVFNVSIMPPEPGMWYECTLEEVCEDKEIPHDDVESDNADNNPVGDENGENN